MYKVVSAFLRSCLSAISRRGLFLAVMNVLYFGSIFVFVLFFQFQHLPPYEAPPVEVPEFFVRLDWPVLIVAISLFNVVLGGFVVVTLPGLLFFPLSVIVLLFRGYSWGLLLSRLSTLHFLVVLPTFVLEGEGYVIASVAGILLGLSWLKPDWAYSDEGLSRLESLKKALRECGRIYLLVAVVLLGAAIVETVTIQFCL